MIQFNLLPSVKMEFVKARRSKHMTMLISVIVGGVSLGIMVLLVLYVVVAQKKNSNDLSADIKSQSAELQNTSDLNKILTIQNQLNSLTPLHDKKPVAIKLLNYVKQFTPANVSIDTLNVDFDAKTMSITGAADALVDINIFVDTLKFTTYKTSANATGQAFSAVVYAGDGKVDKDGIKYSVNFSFDPIIFESTNEVSIIVPKKTTTRSQTEKPLFKQTIDESKGTP